jgi:hypothetical protein
MKKKDLLHMTAGEGRKRARCGIKVQRERLTDVSKKMPVCQTCVNSVREDLFAVCEALVAVVNRGNVLKQIQHEAIDMLIAENDGEIEALAERGLFERRAFA